MKIFKKKQVTLDDIINADERRGRRWATVKEVVFFVVWMAVIGTAVWMKIHGYR